MPKLLHEALVELVRDAPAMVPRLLWPERQELAARVHVAAGEFVDLNLAEYHADAVLVVGDEPTPSRALIVEVQTAIDPRKRRSWPVYVAGLHVRHGCPVDLVVLTLDREVARWAAMPIVIGEGVGRPPADRSYARGDVRRPAGVRRAVTRGGPCRAARPAR